MKTKARRHLGEKPRKHQPYHVDEDHRRRLHAVGDGDGDKPAQRDECPEEAGQVSGHLVYHRERLFHRVAVNEARVLALRGKPNSMSR